MMAGMVVIFDSISSEHAKNLWKHNGGEAKNGLYGEIRQLVASGSDRTRNPKLRRRAKDRTSKKWD